MPVFGNTENLGYFFSSYHIDNNYQYFSVINQKYINTINLKVGDLLIFDKYLFHRSVTNKTNKAKMSCVLSYFVN